MAGFFEDGGVLRRWGGPRSSGFEDRRTLPSSIVGAARSENPQSSFFGARRSENLHVRCSTRKIKETPSSIFGARIGSKIAIGAVMIFSPIFHHEDRSEHRDRPALVKPDASLRPARSVSEFWIRQVFDLMMGFENRKCVFAFRCSNPQTNDVGKSSFFAPEIRKFRGSFFFDTVYRRNIKL